MAYEYNKLKGRIIEKYGSRRKFAEILGLSEVSMSKKLNGTVQFTQEDIIKWCNLLEIPEVEIGGYFFA